MEVSQWRAIIGQWNNRYSTCRVSTNTVKSSGNVSDSMRGGAGPTVSVIILVLAVLLVILSGDVELNPGPWPDVTLEDVVDLLSGVTSKWNEIGSALRVPKDFRDSLAKKSDSPLIKLEDVIDKWIQSKCSEVSWDHLITVLLGEQLEMAAVAKKVKDHLINAQVIDQQPPNTKRSKPSASPESSHHTTVSLPVQHEASSSTTQPITHQMEKYRHDHSGSSDYQTSSVPIIQPVSDHSIEAEGVERYKQDLIEIYKTRESPSYAKKPSPFKKYINLSLVQSKKRGADKSIGVNDILLCESHDIKFPILIKGNPGVGKTTLAWELCRSWACADEESLLRKKWNIVKFIQLRAQEVREAKRVEKLLDPFEENDGFRSYIRKAKGAGKKMLLILDGFDELSHEQLKESSLIMRLLEGVTLSQASIIITTRSSAVQLLPERFSNLEQYIEVKGFEEKDIEDYIKCKFEDDKDALEAFNDYISSHKFIHTLLQVPLHCALVTQLYMESYQRPEDPKFEPKTLTQLYTYFIHCLIQRNTGIRVHDIDKLPHDLKDKFKELARIAAEGIEKQEYVFDIGINDEFGMLQRVDTSTKCGTVQSVSCSFLHLTLQEYLAAYHWSNAPPLEVAGLFKTSGALPIEEYFMTDWLRSSNSNGNKNIHWPALHFYSGLTGVIKTPLEEEITKHILKGWNSVDRFNFILLLFESQNATLVQMVFPQAQDRICEFGGLLQIKSANEAYVTGYCIARAVESVKWNLQMTKHGLIRNLVDGIKHAKLENRKGSFIYRIYAGFGDCDIFQYFDYIEQISEFVKDLCLEYYTDLKSLNSRAPMAKWSFSLMTFKYVQQKHFANSEEGVYFSKSLFSALASFKTLRMVTLSNTIPCESITIADDGIYTRTTDKHSVLFENDFGSPSSSLTKYFGFIPCAVVVANGTFKDSYGFVILECAKAADYSNLRLSYQDCVFFLGRILKLPFGYTITENFGHDLRPYEVEINFNTYNITLFDVNHQFLLGAFHTLIYFYSIETKTWAELKVYVEEIHNYGHVGPTVDGIQCIEMVVTKANTELIVSVLKTAIGSDNIHSLTLVGDSSELTKVTQSLEHLNIEKQQVKTINVAMKPVLHSSGHDYRYSSKKNIYSLISRHGTKQFFAWRVCISYLDADVLKVMKEQKCSLCSLICNWGLISHSELNVLERLSKELFSSTALKELEVCIDSHKDHSLALRLGHILCDIIKNNPLEVVEIANSNECRNHDAVVKLLCGELLNLTTLKVLIIRGCDGAFDELLKVMSYLASRNTTTTHSVVFDECCFTSHQYKQLLDKAISSTGNIKEIYICEEEISTVRAIKEMTLNVNCCHIIACIPIYIDYSWLENDLSDLTYLQFGECVKSLKIYKANHLLEGHDRFITGGYDLL